MYVCHMYVAPTEARRSSDPLKVELEEVVSHPMGDGNKTRVLQKNTQHFEAQDCPSSSLEFKNNKYFKSLIKFKKF